jgi:predicted amino acid dehydrogenase
MKTFAFLFHPTSLKQVKHFWPLTGMLPNSLLKYFLKFKHFRIIHLKKIKSLTGQEIEGYLIVCPLLPDSIFETDEETILNKIIAAGSISAGLNTQILGLEGYVASIADKKPMIYKHLKTAVTSGSSFTAWSVYEAVYKTIKNNDLDLKKCTVTIFGPNNAIGSLCARKFSINVKKLILTGGFTQRLQNIKDTIKDLNKTDIIIEEDTTKAIKQADIIINTYNGPSVLFDIADIKPQAIVCDAAVFKHVAEKAKLRKDLTVIDCDIIKLPLGQKLSIHFGWPESFVCGYLAETMLLAFENKILNYSLGENINLDKMDEIADIAVKHGFEVFVPE